MNKNETIHPRFFLPIVMGVAIWICVTETTVSAAIIGWHSVDSQNDSTPDDAVTGVSATLRGGDSFRSDGNSTDGTYGTLAIPGSPSTANSLGVRTLSAPSAIVYLDITNNTGGDLVLQTLFLDYGRWFANSPKDVDAFYDSGDLDDSDGTSLLDANDLPEVGKVGNYSDFDIDLAGLLTDVTLANTETATFRFVVSDAGASNTSGAFDNVAIAVVPEPSTLALAALSLPGLLACRRRRKR